MQEASWAQKGGASCGLSKFRDSRLRVEGFRVRHLPNPAFFKELYTGAVIIRSPGKLAFSGLQAGVVSGILSPFPNRPGTYYIGP